MNVGDTLKMMGDRLKVAMVVTEGADTDGNLTVIYANEEAAELFGYQRGSDMNGLDVRRLMPQHHSDKHADYIKHGRGRGRIMGEWRDLIGQRADGSPVQIQGNVAEIKDDDERFYVAIFRDRTDQVDREAALEAALKDAEALRLEAEGHKKVAEESLLKERRLSGQISLLRQIYGGTVGLIVMMGVLIIASWVTGHGENNKDALAMIERVLLVLTGILGSAMASVFDTRGKRDED